MQVQLEGAKELERRLNKLDQKEMKKVLRRSVRKSSKPVVSTAKRLSPRRTGLLSKTIKAFGASTSRSRGELSILVGTRGTKALLKKHTGQKLSEIKDGRKGAFYTKKGKSGKRTVKGLRYAHFVLAGTKPHVIKVGNRRWRHPGADANPFFDKAAQMKFRAVVTIMFADLRKQVSG